MMNNKLDKNSKIFVAGHRGMVGHAFLRQLQERGYLNLVVKGHEKLDLTDQAAVNDFFQQEKFDYVILAAAKVGGIQANSTYKADFIYTNIMIAANVIKAAKESGVAKLLNLGSSCIFPKLAPQPLKEESLLTGELEPTNEPYAIAKISAIKLCRYFNEQYQTNFLSVMPPNLYGFNDNYNLETAHVFPALIRKFHLAKLLKEQNFDTIRKDMTCCPLGFQSEQTLDLNSNASIISHLERLGITRNHVQLWGSGEPLREFLYVDDLVDGCLFLLEKYDYNDIGEFVNLGTGEEIRLRDLAEMIRQIIGFQGEIERDLSKPDGTPRKVVDLSRIKSLGWQAQTPLKEGIEKVYQQYLSYESARTEI